MIKIRQKDSIRLGSIHWTILIRNCSTLYCAIPSFKDTQKEATWRNIHIMWKRENAHNQQFLFFKHCFLLFQRQTLLFESYLNCRLQMLSIWTFLKFSRLVKSLDLPFWRKGETQVFGTSLIKIRLHIFYSLILDLYRQSVCSSLLQIFFTVPDEWNVF